MKPSSCSGVTWRHEPTPSDAHLRGLVPKKPRARQCRLAAAMITTSRKPSVPRRPHATRVHESFREVVIIGLQPACTSYAACVLYAHREGALMGQGALTVLHEMPDEHGAQEGEDECGDISHRHSPVRR